MKYLIAVDASDNSRFAFRQAKKNFFTEKDHVYILTVTENPSSYPFEDIFNFSRETYNEMNTKIEIMFSELLKQYGRELTRVGIPHTCLIARGTIRDVICRQTQDLCVDVLIMGRRGMGTLERAFMGSTSQYCVHNVNCSVIVIPFTAKDKLSPTSSEEVLNSEEEFERLEEKEGKGEGYIIQKKCEHPECSADSCSFKNTCRSPSCKDLSCTDVECRDPSCKNVECIKCSKFSKLGQYEREKWQGKGEMKVGFEGSQFGESIPEASKFGVSKAKSDGSKFQKAKSEGSKFQSKFEVPKSKVEERKVTEEKQKCLQCESDVCEKHGKWQGKECNDPLCNKAECMKHGKFQGKSQEKYECNDPLCNKAECMKHGKGALENKGKGVDVNEGSYAAVSGGKSYAAIVEKAEEKYGDDVTDKSEHKGAINVGAGKVEGKVTNQKDSQGNWKETKVDVGFKGKDEKGSEYQGKKYEATIESK